MVRHTTEKAYDLIAQEMESYHGIFLTFNEQDGDGCSSVTPG